jgi:hypothetical protein
VTRVSVYPRPCPCPCSFPGPPAWPKDALDSVANRFLEEVDLSSDAVKAQVAGHMAGLHVGVTEISADFKEMTRRSNYVTPKSFLELIAFYKYLLGNKRSAVGKQISRLDVGLSILRKTQADVAELQVGVEGVGVGGCMGAGRAWGVVAVCMACVLHCPPPPFFF